MKVTIVTIFQTFFLQIFNYFRRFRTIAKVYYSYTEYSPADYTSIVYGEEDFVCV